MHTKPDIIASKTRTLQPPHNIFDTSLPIAGSVLANILSFVGAAAEDFSVNFQMSHHQTVVFVLEYYLDMITPIIFHDKTGEFPQKACPQPPDYFE